METGDHSSLTQKATCLFGVVVRIHRTRYERADSGGGDGVEVVKVTLSQPEWERLLFSLEAGGG